MDTSRRWSDKRKHMSGMQQYMPLHVQWDRDIALTALANLAGTVSTNTVETV